MANSRDKYVLLSSHHPLEKLFNPYVPAGVAEPAVRREVTDLLLQYPNIILWVAGHNHQNYINAITHPDGRHAFWHIRTASHIDWPQQSRVIEIARDGKDLVIGTTILDHAGPIEFNGTNSELTDPVALAGFSRQLAANDWQRNVSRGVDEFNERLRGEFRGTRELVEREGIEPSTPAL